MDITQYVQALITTGGVLMGIWGFVKVITDIKKNNDEEHDRRQKWDKTAQMLEDNKDKWDKGLADILEERKYIVERYDARLDEIESRIDSNHIDTESKIQQTQADLLIITECMAAVLDGLKQLNCNGKVTEAKQTLDAYLIKRAYE